MSNEMFTKMCLFNAYIHTYVVISIKYESYEKKLKEGKKKHESYFLFPQLTQVQWRRRITKRSLALYFKPVYIFWRNACVYIQQKSFCSTLKKLGGNKRRGKMILNWKTTLNRVLCCVCVSRKKKKIVL